MQVNNKNGWYLGYEDRWRQGEAQKRIRYKRMGVALMECETNDLMVVNMFKNGKYI